MNYIIKDLIKIFETNTKSQEILFLLSDVKDVVRQGYYDYELIKIKEFCKINSLFLVLSEFKILLSDDNLLEKNYSNKGIKVSSENPKGMNFVYISKSEKLAYLASYYELINNYKKLGLLLGYPSCCVDFFCNSFSKDNYNLEILSSKPYLNPFTNLSKRKDDIVLLSHFPCNINCKKSISLAKKYFSVLKRDDPFYAKNLMEQLSK